MKLLYDTHILLWAALGVDHLPPGLRETEHAADELHFSAASLWEIAIKASLRRDDFTFDPRLMRRGLLDNGYVEMSVTSEHAVAVAALPMIHRDPFDRLLIAQSIVENVTLVTSDPIVARYPAPIRYVPRT